MFIPFTSFTMALNGIMTKISQKVNKMLITITQNDIDNGIKLDCGNDPVALALKRMGYSVVSVGNDNINLKKNPTDLVPETYKMGLDLAKWLEYFDYGFPVSPARFEVIKTDTHIHVFSKEI